MIKNIEFFPNYVIFPSKKRGDDMKKKSFVAGAIVGGAIVGAVSLLLTPKSGKETRDFIKDKSDDLTNDLKEKGSVTYIEIKDKSNELFNHATGNAKKFVNTTKGKFSK